MRCLRLLPAVLALLACAPPAALVRSLPPGPSEVRVPVAPGQADAVFNRAVEILERRGYHFDECDDGRGALRTDRAELDAPCFGTSCLARQRVVLKVGWRRLALTLRREVWDTACRAWVESADPATRRDMERERQSFVRDLLGSDLERSARIRPVAPRDAACLAAAPCGPEGCELGASREPEPVQLGRPLASRYP